MANASGAPGGRGGEEVGGDVLGLYDVEARTVEEVAPVRSDDGGRAGHRAAAPLRAAQAGGEMDRREGKAAARLEQTMHGSQHGELRAQSTQQVGVHDRVELLGLEGQMPCRRRNGMRAVGHVVIGGAASSVRHAGRAEIADDDATPGSRGEVETGPAGAGADVEQEMVAPQLEQVDESVGLRSGREAGVAVVTTDGLALDRAADVVRAQLVAGVVPLSVLLLL